MKRYLIKRSLAAVPVLVIVAIIVFSLVHVTPGDPATIMAGDQALPEQIERIKEKMGLNDPLYVQLGLYFKNLFRGDLGESVFTKFEVTDLISQRLPPTLSIAAFALLFSILMGIPLGILAAWKANTWVDRVVMIFAVLGLAVPGFWLGFNMIWLFAVTLGWFPAIGYSPLSEGVASWARSITLPSVTVGMVVAALITRMTRSSMLEVLREDYIRTARAKGLRETVVLLRHALKNAALPIVTIIGLSLAGLIAGLVVTETVFAIPGVGRLLVDAVLRRDYPVVQGVVLITAAVYVVVNLGVDLTYAYIDPKIRYQ